MDKIAIIKIGGNIIDDEKALSDFLSSYAALPVKKILIHGGGKLATRLADQLNVPQQMVEGRRITDAETLKIVTMVYAGLVNKNIVAGLQANGCNAVGITGADGNAITAHKRIRANMDYGFAGDIDSVNASFLYTLLEAGFSPVVAPITHDAKGQLLNTNADTIAQEIAQAMSPQYEVTLIYVFEKAGVLLDVADEKSVIPKINRQRYKSLKNEGAIFAGMIPKLDNAFSAIEKGVQKVVIGQAGELHHLLNGTKGTTIVDE